MSKYIIKKIDDKNKNVYSLSNKFNSLLKLKLSRIFINTKIETKTMPKTDITGACKS